MKFTINTKKNVFQFSLQKIKKGNIWTCGTMNRIPNSNYYVPYLDYDFMEEQYVKDEVNHFQEVFNLGDMHIFQSSPKRYHALGFSKMTAREFVELLLNSSVDEGFKNVPRFYSTRNWVLRAFNKGGKDKPKYLYTLKHKTSRQESFAHYEYLKKIYPEVNGIQNSDGLTKLSIISYATAERK